MRYDEIRKIILIIAIVKPFSAAYPINLPLFFSREM